MANIVVKKQTVNTEHLYVNVTTTSNKITVKCTSFGNYSFNGGQIKIVFGNPDKPFQAKETQYLQTVDGSFSITGTHNWYYDNVTVEVSGEVIKEDSSHTSLILGNLVNNIPNSTLKQEDSGYQYVDGDNTYETFKITLLANKGFKFVKGTVKNDLGAEFSYADDFKTAWQYINNNIANLNVGWTFTGQTEETVEVTTVTNNITGTELNYTVDGANVIGSVTGSNTTGNKRYVKCSLSYTTISDEQKNVTLTSTDNKTINFSLSDVQQGSNVIITGNFRFVCLFENALTGCNITGEKEYYLEGETVNITATAKEKTHFDSENIPFAQWKTLLHGTTSYDFTIEKNNKIATLSFTFPTDSEKVADSTLTLLGGTTPDKEVTGYGSINLYLVDNETLDEFSKIRFTKKVNDNYELEYYDIADYVNNIQKIYVNVTDVSKTSLKLANFDTGIETDNVNDSKVHLDFGDVVIPVINDNGNDFNSVMNIFIPFVGIVSIDSDFIGKTINLSYDIDLVTGYCAYFLKCDGIVINSDIAKCSRNVIYKTLANNEVDTVGNDSYLNTVLMGLEPYITIKYFDSVNKTVNNTVETVILSNVAGYAQFENVKLTSFKCLDSEYNEIISLLNNGVYM